MDLRPSTQPAVGRRIRSRSSHPLRVALVLAALLTGGCADTLASMTEHWFYGYVTSAEAGELCLTDARTEDRAAERCFDSADVDVADVATDDLVKVRYERTGDGHGGGRAVEVEIVQGAGRSDR